MAVLFMLDTLFAVTQLLNKVKLAVCVVVL